MRIDVDTSWWLVLGHERNATSVIVTHRLVVVLLRRELATPLTVVGALSYGASSLK